RVRPDFQAGSLTDDAASFNDVSIGAVTEGMINELKLQYAKDWLEWPSDKGAPYLDADSNGVYEPDPNGNAIYGEAGEDIPGIPGASQTLFTLYNDDLSAQLYASPPIGLEIQETYWSYAYTGALGNVIYKKVDLIYKGTAQSSPNSTIDNFYFIQWADPDVGTSTDDFAGCDTALNLGYAYSAGEDQTYGNIGLPSAAVGYDYLQGVSQFTGNPNDSAIFNLKWRTGYKYVNSKPMSSFIYFAAGGNWSDPTFNYQGTIEFYNYMKGLTPSGGAFPTEVADVTPFGTYLLAGDPVAGTGKIDGTAAAGAPGDRRILVVNGPINLKLGDTAEVVIALVGGFGTDNISSITAMKDNDETAQIVFDQLFQLPTLPPPDVNIAELDNILILDWGSNSVVAANIESFSGQGYNFEGYEVYQLPNPSAALSEGVKLVTFDLVNGITTIIDTVEQSGVLLGVITVTGQDKGIKRFLEVTKDPFRGNQPLRNGQEYYFAVIPYAFNPAPLLPFHALQSSIVIKVGVPQSPLPGVRYSSSSGDTLAPPIHVGSSDGSVTAIVVDPTSTTGQEYKVTFPDDGTWSVTNVTTGNVAASNQTNQSGDEAYPIVDGIMVKVLGPQPDFKDFLEVANANGPHDPTLATFLFNGSGFPSSFPPEVDRPTPDPAGASWGIQTGENGSGSFTYEFFKSRVLRGDNGLRLIPFDYELRFVPGKGQMAFTTGSNVDIPFQIWNIGSQTPNDASDDFQMIPLINDVNADETFNLDGVDHPISGGDNDPETDWIYWYEPADKAPGTVGYDAWVNSGFNDAQIGNEVMARMVLVTFNAGSVSDPTFPANLNESLPAPGSVYRLISTKPNTVNDVFTFTAPGTSFNSDLAKADVDKVNVFPNPYYGFHYRETSRDAKYVTFSHLPGNAIIRIFDLSGVMVRTITKNDPTTDPDQFTTWDLKNNDNYPVASGIYIIHIDMPELGATKILKLAIVQEEQILKVY
ncbi:MAG: T9SS type A sorting domain-containing protein, partial [Ignavibacteria bacterium]|nr:T9SS type A sorting domain-containing protein [Ignavibacteria bacterium]